MTKSATFGAGCFWGVELTFRQIKGVKDAAVGYSGGSVENPTYRDVCSGHTGHAEVVHLEYDPNEVSFTDLVKVFFKNHNPTTPNRQGPDVGTQYRSVIFYHDTEQEEVAENVIKQLTDEDAFGGRAIVTQVVPFDKFWKAEEYHQRYLEKNGLGNCHLPS